MCKSLAFVNRAVVIHVLKKKKNRKSGDVSDMSHNTLVKLGVDTTSLHFALNLYFLKLGEIIPIKIKNC